MILPEYEQLYVDGSFHYGSDILFPANWKGDRLFFGPTLDVLEATTSLWGESFEVKVGAVSLPSLSSRRKPYLIKDIHQFRCAVDLLFTTEDDLRYAAALLRQAAAELHCPIRMGWRMHLVRGVLFIHLDTAPLLADQALSHEHISQATHRQWEKAGLEW